MLKQDMILAGCAVLMAVWGLTFIKRNAGALAAGAVGIVADAGAGVVVGAGDILGVPRTDETACELAQREGRTWDASFACPIGTFVRGVFD